MCFVTCLTTRRSPPNFLTGSQNIRSAGEREEGKKPRFGGLFVLEDWMAAFARTAVAVGAGCQSRGRSTVELVTCRQPNACQTPVWTDW